MEPGPLTQVGSGPDHAGKAQQASLNSLWNSHGCPRTAAAAAGRRWAGRPPQCPRVNRRGPGPPAPEHGSFRGCAYGLLRCWCNKARCPADHAGAGACVVSGAAGFRVQRGAVARRPHGGRCMRRPGQPPLTSLLSAGIRGVCACRRQQQEAALWAGQGRWCCPGQMVRPRSSPASPPPFEPSTSKQSHPRIVHPCSCSSCTAPVRLR